MTLSLSKTSGTAVVKACFFTAVLNSLFAPGYAQEAFPEGQPQTDLAQRALQWGPFDIRPSLRGAMVYDDNIFIQPDNKQGDLIVSLAPSVLIGAGDYAGRENNLFTLRYTPTLFIFADHTEENALDHDARLEAELHEPRWTLAFGQSFQALSGSSADVGDRVDRRVFNTVASFAYEISPKTSFDLNARQTIYDYDEVRDYNEWTFGGGADYAVTPKIKVGLGTVFGFLDVRSSANQTYQQLLARASYSLTEKLEARGSIGGEVRQFEGDEDSRGNLVFSAGASYKPLVNTTVNFDTYRRNQNSVVLADQNFTSTGVSAGVRQLFREKYAGHVTASYENDDYEANAGNVIADREDNYYSVRCGADWQVLEKLNVGLFYQYRRNNSTLSQFEFDNHQVGLTAGYQF